MSKGRLMIAAVMMAVGLLSYYGYRETNPVLAANSRHVIREVLGAPGSA